MDIKEKAKIFARCANAVQLPIDNISGEVLLKISEKIDEKGSSITLEDINDIVEPYLSKQEAK